MESWKFRDRFHSVLSSTLYLQYVIAQWFQLCSRGASRALNFLLVWQHTPSLVASVASCNLRTIHTTRTARCRCSQAHFPGLNPLSSNPSPVSVCNRRLCPPPGIRPRSPQVAYPMALRIVPTTPRPQRQLGSRINRTPGRQPGDAMSSHMIRSLIQLNRSAEQGSEIPALTEDVIGEISNEANWSYGILDYTSGLG